jgi:hypothetical protein
MHLEDRLRTYNGPLVATAHIPCTILRLHNLEEKLLSYFPEQVSEAGDRQRWILNPCLEMYNWLI